MEPHPTYSAEEKLKWEIEKLQAETQNLKRPWIANPASWLAIVTTVIALTTAFAQYRLNKIETAQLHLDGTKIKIENDSLALKKKTLTIQVQALSETVKTAAGRLTALLVEPTPSAPGPNKAQTVSQLQTSVDALNTIDEAIQSPNSSSQFVVVIATLQTPERAVNRAKGIMAEPGNRYLINVYRKADRQYVLTLGGRLTYGEANALVKSAHQSGYPDAVVRSAKAWGANLNE